MLSERLSAFVTQRNAPLLVGMFSKRLAADSAFLGLFLRALAGIASRLAIVGRVLFVVLSCAFGALSAHSTLSALLTLLLGLSLVSGRSLLVISCRGIGGLLSGLVCKVATLPLAIFLLFVFLLRAFFEILPK